MLGWSVACEAEFGGEQFLVWKYFSSEAEPSMLLRVVGMIVSER